MENNQLVMKFGMVYLKTIDSWLTYYEFSSMEGTRIKDWLMIENIERP